MPNRHNVVFHHRKRSVHTSRPFSIRGEADQSSNSSWAAASMSMSSTTAKPAQSPAGVGSVPASLEAAVASIPVINDATGSAELPSGFQIQLPRPTGQSATVSPAAPTPPSCDGSTTAVESDGDTTAVESAVESGSDESTTSIRDIRLEGAQLPGNEGVSSSSSNSVVSESRSDLGVGGLNHPSTSRQPSQHQPSLPSKALQPRQTPPSFQPRMQSRPPNAIEHGTVVTRGGFRQPSPEQLEPEQQDNAEEENEEVKRVRSHEAYLDALAEMKADFLKKHKQDEALTVSLLKRPTQPESTMADV